jgi:membrane protein implicated in regulation of membrane protease activity
MIALAFLAGGLSRLSGASGAMQFIIAAVVAVVALASLRRIKRRRRLSRGDLPISGVHSTGVPHPTGIPSSTGEARDTGDIDGPPDDINESGLDIGAQVYVLHWQGRRARVHYRGAEWDVMLAHGAVEAPGWYRICRIEGITLILAP